MLINGSCFQVIKLIYIKQMDLQTTNDAEANLILDYKIVFGFGIFNSSWHLIAGILWQLIRIPQVNPQHPISYFGGYLSLIGMAQMLIFIYLFLFYCRKVDKSPHLFNFRFVLCNITIAISLLVLIMIMAKTIYYISQTQSKYNEKYGIIIAVNIIDILVTIYTIPSYIFLTICHYQQLRLARSNQNPIPIQTDRQNLQNDNRNEGAQPQQQNIPTTRASQEQRIDLAGINLNNN